MCQFRQGFWDWLTGVYCLIEVKSLLGSILNKAPIPFTRGSSLGGYGGGGGTASQETIMKAYGAVSTLFAIVDRLATSVASPDWHLMRKGTDTEVLTHPCIDLWNNPNDFYTQNDFIEAVQQHMDLVGEQWWIVARSSLLNNAGPPLELWPVRPDRIQPIPDRDNFISGYLYSNGNEKVLLGLDDVIWTKKQNPLDPYRGMGPVQTIMADLDAEKYSAAWNANFFRNSAEPGGLILVDRKLSDAEFEEMALRWREQHQGVANAHRVGILEKAQWVDRKYTQREMQFQQLREMNKEIIRGAFAFPKAMLGDTVDVNRANAEAGEVMFQRWLIVPRLERIKQLLNGKILPMYGPSGVNLEWVYDNPVPEDKKGDAEILAAAADAVQKLIQIGFDPEEVLEVCHLPPMKYEKPEPVAPPQTGNPGDSNEPGQSLAPAKNELVRQIMNTVRDASKKDMEKQWTKRFGNQQTALEEWLEKRWG